MTEVEGGALAGRRILIVEDRYLLAVEIAEEIERLGCQVIGPARNVAAARNLLADQAVDAAVLDVNLDGEMVFSLAEILAAKGAPFVFLTGYDHDLLPARWRDHPQLYKPVSARRLREQLEQLCGAA